MLKNNRGYSLIELLLAMGIFITVMLVTSNGFNTVLTQVGQQTKFLETDIGSVVGLEFFRSDLQTAGYGLPWAFQDTPLTGYEEVKTSDDTMPVGASFWPTGRSPRSFNDAPSGVPRAVLSGNTTFNESGGVGSQYLVLKSLTVLPAETAKKWATATYGDAGRSTPTWGDAERDFDPSESATEKVMVLRNTFIDGIPTRQLQVNGGVFATNFRNYTTLTLPHSSGDVFQVYGIDETSAVRMPFNRADYYVRRPSNVPPACAPNTGILYKAALNHGSDGFTEVPLLDCVADMQIVYGVGPVASTQINFHQTTLPATWTAKEIREQVKEIRIYILGHLGRKDNNYAHPVTQVAVGENFGAGLQGRMFDLPTLIGTDWEKYRWKLYTIVVRPQNLIQ